MHLLTIDDLVTRFDLKPHPEGGYFSESYRATGIMPQAVLNTGATGDRNFSTGIYYLLPTGTISKLHRILHDEMLHFYLGDPLDVYLVSPLGDRSVVTMGQAVLAGEQLQFVVQAGTWFGFEPQAPGAAGFSLIGCTVAPGFDFADFEMPDTQTLLAQFPEAEDWIKRLT